MGRTVDIPSEPKKMVAHYYAAEFTALGFHMVGTNYLNAKLALTDEQLSGVEDIGGEGLVPNLEKTLSLNPDLIVIPDFIEAKDIEALSKIAPTIAISYSANVFTRLRTLADIVGQPDKAEDWIQAYEAKAVEKSALVKSLIQEGETASAFIKSLTGQTPNHYINSLRIEQAKRLLTSSSARVNEIARRVGFRDEYYFSRRFKQTTGMSPSQFAHDRGTSSRIFSIQYLGELLALGIRPVGTNRAMLQAFPEASYDITGIEEPMDVHQLMELKPDLILYPSFIPPGLVKELSLIATAVEIDWNADVYTRLHQLGDMLDRTKEASEWIARYKEKAERTRYELRGSIRKGETASAFVYHANGLYVYGGHHFGHTLYQGIGFEPPAGIQAWIDGNRNAKWKPILPEAMSDYAGDRVFIALADTGSDALKGRQLLEHPAWKSLPAVRKGKSYVVKDKWASYNPVTLEKHLDEMVKCLLPR